MKIVITGATGLVGMKLLEELFHQGFEDINIISRSKKSSSTKIPFPVNIYEWDLENQKLDTESLEDADCVIHLAGDGVADGRWTQAKKDKIKNSRVWGTELIMNTAKKCKNPPKKIISASAVGIYGNRDDEVLTESSKLGYDFLADVCKEWENILIDQSEIQTHSIRVGVVLAKEGGALQKMLPPFQAGVGGILGNGKQYMSWIHIDDLVGQIIFLTKNNFKTRIFNGVSPSPVSNSVFTKVLGKTLKRPTLFPVPAFVIKLLFGEMSTILLSSQKVLPQNFQELGYEYKFAELSDALSDILKYTNRGEMVLKRYQWVDQPVNQVFSFFSNEKNLEKITPPYLNFKVLGKNTEKIEEGTIIDYKLSLHGLPMKWQSKINDFQEREKFIDEQVKGPYSKWVHTHSFHEVSNGTLIKDEIVYKIPFGILGQLIGGFFVSKDLKNIFNYRRQVIKEIF